MIANQVNISPADEPVLGCTTAELDDALDAVFADWGITETATKAQYIVLMSAEEAERQLDEEQWTTERYTFIA